jgi:preprotein translocase subunit SecA
LVEDYLKIYKQGEGAELDSAGLISFMNLNFGLQLDPQVFNGIGAQEAKDRLSQELLAAYANKEKLIGPEILRDLERMVFLQIIDSKWKDHLYAMDSLREGIGLRAYGQRDPLIEYKREAFEMFSQMIGAIEEDSVQTIYKLEAARPERFQGVFSSLPTQLSHPETANFAATPQRETASAPVNPPAGQAPKPAQAGPKVGRNDPCPCGSGKKYKKCCGE